MQDFKQPPLAFMGNKRYFLTKYKKLLEDMAMDGAITKETIFYDVFGGSGFLSHHTKAMFKENEVIYNDFDDYSSRLEMIEKTELIRGECVKILGQRSTKKDKLDEDKRQKLISFLDSFDESELDFTALSAWFCFSGQYYKDKKSLFTNLKYNCLSFTPLNAKGYLEGVKRVKMDFKELLKIANEAPQKAFLILDPPYLQTQVGNYNMHFTLKNFIYLLENIKSPFILFSSEKSDILELLEVFKRFFTYLQGFRFDETYLSLRGKEGKNVDYMIYKCQKRGLFTESELTA